MKKPDFCLILVIMSFTNLTYSQVADSTKLPFNFGVSVTVTTKGISTVPNLTLGKPAAIFDLAMGKGRLSFEPNLRFALEGRPWSFLFWWRYKLVQKDRFRISLGAHPALSFRMREYPYESGTQKTMVVYRYLAGELSPTYFITKNTGVGLYWLYSRGIEKELTRNTNLISFRASFTDISLTKNYFLRFYPQVYYLNMDKVDGFYINSVLTLSRRNFPLSISSLVNNPIHTNITAGNEFLWNVSLIYSINNQYHRISRK
jgi:hypothetical protein